MKRTPLKRKPAKPGPQAVWCRSQRCCVCGCPPGSRGNDAHHAVLRAQGGKDHHCVPLCWYCHGQLHDSPRGIAAWEVENDIVLVDVAALIAERKPWTA